MKPMGTVTKYYPFIDDDTKSILDTLMDEASNYYDFVGLLCKTVLENEVPINLGYLAAGHAWWTRKKDVIDLSQEKYKDVPHIHPWKYIPDMTDMDQQFYHDQIVQAIDKILESPQEDWIEIELHLLHAMIFKPSSIVILVQIFKEFQSLSWKPNKWRNIVHFDRDI